jgi:hypothetical protein
MSANNRFVKQTAPKTIHPLNFSPYSTGIQLDISITGPAPLDQWSGNSTAPSSFQSTSMISQSSIPVIPMAAPQPQAPGGSASIPSAVDAASLATLGAVSLPAAVVSVAVNCLFTDDSAKIPYDQQESSYVAGNHGHYEVKLQQLQVNLQGNPSPDPYTGSPTWWADVDTVTGDVLLSNGSVSPAVADLYGAGATAAYAGSNPVAAANANVSTTITLPINLTSVLGVYRFALRYFLGDTRS